VPENKHNPTMATRNQVKPNNWDGHRAIAAAVILRAVKDLKSPGAGYSDSAEQAQARQKDAAKFLQGDMEPWASFLGLDPETDLQYRQWCRGNGLVAGKFSEENV